MAQDEVGRLLARLHEAQAATSARVQAAVGYDELGEGTPSGHSVTDVLEMWVWHYWSHHRELVLARGRLTGDNPHFHVPHFVRHAHEEFGRFAGELATLTDEQLDLRLPDGGASVRELTEHVLEALEWVAGQVEGHGG